MMIPALEGHRSIGWDFDGTLVEHRFSVRMHAFIRAFPDLDHHIITFRTHGMEHQVWHDLAAYPNAPDRSLFRAVHGIDYALFEQYEQARRLPRKRRGALSQPEVAYTEWKARKCKELGLTILVDDMRGVVKAGCEKHGIAYLHPDDLMRW